MPRSINLIVIHCSATPSGQWLTGTAPGNLGRRTPLAVIEGWHRQRGFNGIGYHYLVDIDGVVWKGRPEDQAGAHVAGHNANSIGICLVGGAERDGRFTPKQWESLAGLVQDVAKRHKLALTKVRTLPLAGKPSGPLCGHRDLSPDLNNDGKVQPTEWLKTCPGFDVTAWLQRGFIPEARNVYTEVVK